MTTRAVQPGNADAVSLFEVLGPRAKRGNYSRAFVTRHERRRRLHRPITVGGVQIRVANAACFDLDEGLTFLGFGDCQFIDDQRLPKLMNHRGFHLLCHTLFLSLECGGTVRGENRGEPY
jgi:hypothetical protein